MYACHKSFKSHLRSHTLEEAASRFPDVDTVLAHSEEIANQALTNVANSISVGVQGDKFHMLVGHVIGLSSVDGDEWKTFSYKVCEVLLQSLQSQKFRMPSALLNSLVEQQERLVSDFELCDGFLKILKLDEAFEEDLPGQVMLELTLNLHKEILAFISKTFKANLPQRSQPLRSDPDKEDRQVIFYIAGSIIRGYVRKARRYPKCAVWQKVVNVFKSHILTDKPNGQMDFDSEWTRDVDRGSLFYITAASEEFFVKVTKVIFANEKHDGSIDYDAVVKNVGESGLCAEWDAIISESLEPELSAQVMADVVTSMCRTCGTGFAKRRLNFIRKKPVVSLPTRHLVASRKNR